MGRKKLKSLAAFLATMSASFFIPLVVNADDCTSISATECIGGCNGHTISNDTKRIQVSGGRHTITLENVNIDTSKDVDPNDPDKPVYSAFDITGDATIELTLVGKNSLKSPDGYAGLHIPSGSHLTIKGEGSLEATGGNNGAGIGSQGIDGASGEVTIAVAKTSTITATGGSAAAGIGGGQGGGCGKVTVESGNVKATGGDGYVVKHPVTGDEVGKVAGGTGIGTGGGGHLEQGESPEDCLLREVKEETGLTLTSFRFRGLITFLLDGLQEYMCLYTADAFIGELTDCDEGDLEWVEKSRIGTLPLWEGDRIFFRLLEEEHPFFSLKLCYEEGRLCEAVLDGNILAI